MTRSREPLEYDIYNGTRINLHGETGYKRGCGCDVCRAGHAQYGRDERARKAREREARAAGAEAAEAARRVTLGLPPEDDGLFAIQVKVRLSEQGKAALDRHLAEIGETESAFIRGLIHKATGFEDTARRRSSRRPNRKQQEGQQ